MRNATIHADARALYVTYDGLAEPLGESQVLPYVRGLAERGQSFHLLSFEKQGAPLSHGKLIAPGVRWFALRYHKWPSAPATAFDMAQGLGATALLDVLGGVRLVHVRSYVPATMVLPWILFRGRPLLFDMRGLWADERIEAGSWKRTDPAFRAAKSVERQLLRHAAVITVLTESMRLFLREEYVHRHEIRASIRVIPTCTDLALFHPAAMPDEATARAVRGARVLAYLGSLGGRYLPESIATFYLHWRKATQRARLLVVSKEAPTGIAQVLARAGVHDEIVHRPAERGSIPGLLRCAHAGVFFYREALSTRGTAPTKVGEMLATGLPVAGNAVGDIARVLRGKEAGIVLEGTTDDDFARAAAELLSLEHDPSTPLRARALAEKWFSLERGIDAYQTIYDALLHGRADDLGDAGWPADIPTGLAAARPGVPLDRSSCAYCS